MINVPFYSKPRGWMIPYHIIRKIAKRFFFQTSGLNFPLGAKCIFGEKKYIEGFAVENDIFSTSRSGIKNTDL